MNDTELTRRVAEEVMGWEEKRGVQRISMTRSPTGQGGKIVEKPYTYWERPGNFKPLRDFDPLHNPAHLQLVEDEMVRRGFIINIHIHDTCVVNLSDFNIKYNYVESVGEDKSKARAFCLACLGVMGSE